MGKAVIAIHGGAGAITRAQMSQEQEQRYIQALSDIVETGQKMLESIVNSTFIVASIAYTVFLYSIPIKRNDQRFKSTNC